MGTSARRKKNLRLKNLLKEDETRGILNNITTVRGVSSLSDGRTFEVRLRGRESINSLFERNKPQFSAFPASVHVPNFLYLSFIDVVVGNVFFD